MLLFKYLVIKLHINVRLCQIVIVTLNLEIDSQILLNWLTTYGVLASELSILILDCRTPLSQEWIINPRHVFREANGMANELARGNGSTSAMLENINECPNFVFVRCVCDILQLGTCCECPIDNTCNSAP